MARTQLVYLAYHIKEEEQYEHEHEDRDKNE